MQILSSGLTDVGLKREGNEDALHLEDSLGLYIVADGMGGHLAGEVASQVAVNAITKGFRKWTEEETHEDELFGAHDESLTLHGNYVLSSIRAANRIVNEMALECEQYHGMGTTIVVLLVEPELVIAANVGDSRLYLVRNGRIERLSRDHTLVSEQVERGAMTPEEAESSPLKHVLTRNLGSSESVEPDIFELEPNENDRFILCTDGLTDLVKDEEILVMTEKEDDPDALCRQFVGKALKRGGHDNTTVISVSISGLKKPNRGILGKAGLLLSDFVVILRKIIKKVVP